jgi:hypothetical protein
MPGCASLVKPTDSPEYVQVQRFAPVVKMVAQVGTGFAVQAKPNLRPWFEASVIVLNVAISEGQYDPDVLKSRLLLLKVNELKSEEVVMSIQVALQAYSTFFSDWMASNPTTNKEVIFRPILVALRDGISLGIGGAK